jgi:hypothetical protein
MEYKLRHAHDGPAEVAAAHHPEIRHFRVERNLTETPADTLAGAWQTCEPRVAGEFTAVGYFFAREIAQKTGHPVGLINATIGGTPVEAWMSEATLRADPAFDRILERRENTSPPGPPPTPPGNRRSKNGNRNAPPPKPPGNPSPAPGPPPPWGQGTNACPSPPGTA